MASPASVADGKRLVDSAADSNDRVYTVFIHLAFLILPFPIVPQLIMWLIRRDVSPFVDDHGREAVNFQITLILFAAISGLLVIVGVGLLLLLALPWFGIICSILGAVAAGRGEYFRYPMTIRFLQ